MVGLTPLIVTKADIRGFIAQTIRDNRAAGVPEDGIAEILAQWVAAHLHNGTTIAEPPPAAASSALMMVDQDVGANTPAGPKHLTKAQLDELRRLAVKPQRTYGAHTARVQNNLVWSKLARFLDPDGKVTPVCNWMGMKNLTELCEITDAGRRALAEHRSKTATKKGRHR